ncbi:hypothetical protein D3C81_1931110 [compost metagenome]
MAPALAGSSLTEAGRSITYQCQKPEPVGASGSYTFTAKPFVPSGAPLQRSTGDWFRPLQPKPSNSKLCAMVLPSAMSGLVRVKAVMRGTPGVR